MRKSALLGWVALFALPALASPPARLVEDIRTDSPEVDSTADSFIEAGGSVYFWGPDPITFYALWRTDGTEAGTHPVKALQRYGESLFEHAGDVYFGAGRGYLWRSGGTPESTAPVPPREDDGSFLLVGDFASAGGWLFFTASDTRHGYELWKSDGTSQGTALVRDVFPGPESSSNGRGGHPAALGSRVVFCADDGVHGREPWVSDGTAGGTILLRDIHPGGSSLANCHRGFVAAGQQLYFFADDGVHGSELWATDGTGEGTVLVKDMGPGSQGIEPGELVAMGGRILFTEGTSAPGQTRLWRSDGTTEGTILLRSSFFVTELTATSGQAFFASEDFEHGIEPWRTDGTVEGTVPVEDIVPGFGSSMPRLFCPMGNAVFFVTGDAEAHGSELWRSDGTPAGTFLLRDILPGSRSAYPFLLTAAGGKLYFTAQDGIHGREPWTSDGTVEGTVLLKDLRRWNGSNPARLTDLSGKLLFTVSDELGRTSLWKSDGSAEGTDLVTFFSAPISGGLVPWSGKLFFSQHPVRDYYEPDDLPFPWVTDGTAGGTLNLSEVEGGGFVPLDDEVLFMGYDPATGFEPWRSDGTPAGTSLVRDVVPGPGGSRLVGIVGEDALLVADGSLWTSDGSSEGTTPFVPIPPDLALDAFVPVGDVTYFLGRADSVHALWRTDGTAEGTFALEPSLGSLRFFYPVAAGDTLFALGTEDAFHYSLWKTAPDGDALVRVRDGLDTRAIYPLPLAAAGTRVFFSANDLAHGQELWTSDGTDQGTRPVRDIAPGVESSTPGALAGIDDVLLFAASDGLHGFEVWRTDGTEAGTVLVQDIAPGPASSSPGEFRAVGARVFFSADDGVHGQELWVAWRGILTGKPRRALTDLHEEVEALELSDGSARSLLAKIEAAASALDRGDSAGAARRLDGFGRILSSMRGRRIPASDADALADLAAQTMDLLNAGSGSRLQPAHRRE